MNALVCRNCSIMGQVRIIGELLPEGNIAIRRKIKSYGRENKSATVIKGDNFTVYCGDCGQPMYQKKQTMYYQIFNGSISGTIDLHGTSFV